ncbi:hypothetical protein AY586_06960 [Marichromatium gracile]|uniref:Secreted protein n=1 Tax=Marichromatium gracile TaxID=1048 RepID=A0ABR5VKS7_MARGR|nr:hypothetical protein AY586_06960 [Marichromatium gracile]
MTRGLQAMLNRTASLTVSLGLLGPGVRGALRVKATETARQRHDVERPVQAVAGPRDRSRSMSRSRRRAGEAGRDVSNIQQAHAHPRRLADHQRFG